MIGKIIEKYCQEKSIKLDKSRERFIIASLKKIKNPQPATLRKLVAKMVENKPTTVLGYSFREGKCPNCSSNTVPVRLLRGEADYCVACRLALPKLKENYEEGQNALQF